MRRLREPLPSEAAFPPPPPLPALAPPLESAPRGGVTLLTEGVDLQLLLLLPLAPPPLAPLLLAPALPLLLAPPTLVLKPDPLPLPALLPAPPPPPPPLLLATLPLFPV